MYGLARRAAADRMGGALAAGLRELAAPVRIGNAAHEQFQLDVYGEVMDAFTRRATAAWPSTETGWELQRALVDHVRKDLGPAGRAASGRCAAAHAALHLFQGRWPGSRSTARSRASRHSASRARSSNGARCATAIHAEVCDKGFDAERNSFVRAYGSDQLDASLLLLAAGRLPASPTIRASSARSRRSSASCCVDGFVLRYDTATRDDGLPPGEGAFLACSFWLADAYVSIGRRDDAERCSSACWRSATTSACSPRNTTRAPSARVGNFPQAFCHVALINTAFNLTRADQAAGAARRRPRTWRVRRAPKSAATPGTDRTSAMPGWRNVDGKAQARRASSSRSR